ncbi:MAG: hypothetical protein RMK29_00195 [Myxococcales bacterium]|nr:hypothetical protein [Myxococcales bacterium]
MEDDTLAVSGAPARPLRAVLVVLMVTGAASVRPAWAEGLPRLPLRVPVSPLPLLAQAEPAPPEQSSQDRPAPGEPQAQPTAPPGDACRADGDCPRGTLCFEGHCQRPQRGVSALFYFHRPGPSGHRIVVPFYFSFWQPGASTRVLMPFFADARNEVRRSRDLVLPLLFYQYHREPGVTSHRLWPLVFYTSYGPQGRALGILPWFYSMRRGDQRLAVVPPLLSFYHASGAQKLRQLFLFGLAYWRQQGQSQTVVVPPLLSFFHQRGESSVGLAMLLGWARKTPERTLAGVFPLAWHVGHREGYTTVVLPLVWAGANHRQGLWYLTALPLFHYRRDEDGRRRMLLTPLGGYYRDEGTGTTASALLVPPLVHREDPDLRLTVLPPLGLWLRNKRTGQSTGFTGPLFWSVDDQGSTAGVFPLYVRFHNRLARATTDVIFPLALVHRAPGRAFAALGPLYFWRRQGGSVGFGLFPLLWARAGRQSYGLLPPLVAYVADADAGTRHLSVGPLFWQQRQRGPQAGYDAGVLPLLFVGRRGEASYQALLPLFWHSRTGQHERWLLGPLFVERRLPRRPNDPEAGVSATLFPLLWVHRSAAQSHVLVPPLLWLGRQGQQVTAAVPPLLLFMRGGPAGRLAFGPGFFYRSGPEETTLLLGPYGYVRRQSPAGAWTAHALWPIAFFHRSPGRSADVLFPLFLQAREEGMTVRSIGLLYWGVSRPGLVAHALFPLLLHVGVERGSTTVVATAFYHRRQQGDRRAWGLLPLFAWGHDERTTVVATPLGFFYRDRKEERIRSAALLYYGDYRRGRADWGLVPLVFGWQRGTTTSWLGPFVFHSRDPAQGRWLTVLGPLFFGRNGAASFGGLAPLLFARNGGDGSYRFTAFPLFHFDYVAGKMPTWRLFTPLFGFIRTPVGLRAYLLSAYLRRDASGSTDAVLPFFYHRFDRPTESRTLLVLPLLFRATTPESTFTAITPLLWQYTSLTRRTVLWLPFLADDHHLFQKRLTAAGPLVPLFIRQRDHAENTTTWIFPPLLLWVKQHAEGHDAALFPLFWHFRSAERTTTVLFPLGGYLRRPSYRAGALLPFFFYYQDEAAATWVVPPLLAYYRRAADGGRTLTVPPLVYHRSDRNETSTVVLPLLWYKRRGDYRSVLTPLGGYRRTERGHHLLVLNVYVTWGAGPYQGEWDVHIWPLLSFGRPRRNDLQWNVLGGLVGYSRLGAERMLRLLWFIPIPLAPAGRRSAWYGATLRMSGAHAWY